MARYTVYRIDSGAYLLDVQSDLLNDLATRIVIPLMPLAEAPKPARRLNPVFEIGNAPYVLVTQFLAAVPLSLLATPVADLSAHDTDIANALDMLFHGF